MTTLITDAELNAEADRSAGQINALSLHTASPGTTGANEASGGSPLYARKAPVFNAAGAVGPLGAILQPATVGVAWSNEVVFDVPAGSYTHWGGWSALTGGVYKRGNTLSTTQSPSGQAVIVLSISVGPYAGA